MPYRSLYPNVYNKADYPPCQYTEDDAPYRDYRNQNICDATVEECRLKDAFRDKYPPYFHPVTDAPPSWDRTLRTPQFLRDTRYLAAHLATCDGVLVIREYLRERQEEEQRVFDEAVLALLSEDFMEMWGVARLPVGGGWHEGDSNNGWGTSWAWGEPGAWSSGSAWGTGPDTWTYTGAGWTRPG
ncbi:hypothetical protein C8R44DRAFT_881481 [Mycena epipterygia]|nr:hypothetical protein C8R44DRAFT_881481 [Mycena epipterygia]